MEKFSVSLADSHDITQHFLWFTESDIATWLFWLWILATIYSLGFILFMSMFFIMCWYTNLYKYWYKIEAPYDDTAWNGARDTIVKCTFKVGRLWHGYEVIGTENIPDVGAAIVVFYHGPAPIDLFYFKAATFLKKNRFVRFVALNILFKLPGCEPGLRVTYNFPGDYEECIETLKNGHLLGIAPGGAVESQFAESYNVHWGSRRGFARLAIQAKVPIIPAFTENTREAFNNCRFARSWLRPVYEKIKIPVVLPCGGLPVKLRTYVGEPIPYDPDITAEQLAEKTIQAIESLILKHQQIPGNVFKALLDRVYDAPKKSA